jgi:hypothetical protein
MSDAGEFLVSKAKERRNRFVKRRGWLLAACLTFLLLTATALALLFPNPLAPWVTERELRAFWIGAGAVGVVCALLYLLGLDGGRNLRDGADGEKWTAAALKALRRRGWAIFHDIQLDGRNIDHALIGRQGAVAVETKWTSDELRVDASGILKVGLDGRTRREYGPIQDARRHARDLRLLLHASRVRTEVLPVLVLWGARVERIEGGARWVGNALVCVGAQAKQWRDSLTGQPLDESQVAKAVRGLEARKQGRWVRVVSDSDPIASSGSPEAEHHCRTTRRCHRVPGHVRAGGSAARARHELPHLPHQQHRAYGDSTGRPAPGHGA